MIRNIPHETPAFTPILEGQHNFRDLGGLPASEGLVTRSGLLYRSGDLNSITDNDVDVLERLGLAGIIDFRSVRERLNRPDRWIPSVREIKNIAINDSAREQALVYLNNNDADGWKTCWSMTIVESSGRIRGNTDNS